MRVFFGSSVAACAAAFIMAAIPAASAADQKVAVKARVAFPVVVCSNLNWSHGWLNHGGWGGWGYQDGLIIDGWTGSCSTLVGVGPYAYAPREGVQAPPKR